MGKGIQVLSNDRPAEFGRKKIVKLAVTEFIRVDMQYVGKDGATNLHSHSGNDGFWLVMSGRARFYEEADEPVAELGVGESVLVPHGTPYWFESAGEEPLEILHVAARTRAAHDKRVDYRERTQTRGESVTAAQVSA